MILDRLLIVLSNADLGVPGESLYLQHMPWEINQGVLLLEPLLGTEIDHELVGYYKFRFEVVIRHVDYLKGRTLANQVSSALSLQRTSLDGLWINYVRPVHLPVPYPRSSGDYLEFSVHFDACYVDA